MFAAARNARIVAVLAAGTLAPHIAHADVFKCAGEGGIPIYQEMPCAAGKELRNFQTDPPEITVLPAGRTNAPPAVPKNAPAKDAKTSNDAKPGKSARIAGDAAERMHASVGMTEAEVLTRLGPPDTTAGSKTGGSARWTYLPAPGDPETTTALVLNKGVVVEVERKVIKK